MSDHSGKPILQLDKVGICLSLICVLHCLAGPILFIAGADSLLRLIDHEWIELLIIGFSLVIGLIAFLGGYLIHRQHYIPILFLTGFLLIINGESVSQQWLALLLSVSGASVLIYAHFQNFKWRYNACIN